MSAPTNIKVGATRRLELHTARFAAATYHLPLAHVGELFQMLMAEVGLQPVSPATNRFVAEAYENRAGFRRIKGSFGRENLSLAVRKAVFERDDRACRYCNSELTWAEYHCDHVHPVSRQGDSAMGNLAASCQACNRSKGAKTVAEWRGSQ